MSPQNQCFWCRSAAYPARMPEIAGPTSALQFLFYPFDIPANCSRYASIKATRQAATCGFAADKQNFSSPDTHDWLGRSPGQSRETAPYDYASKAHAAFATYFTSVPECYASFAVPTLAAQTQDVDPNWASAKPEGVRGNTSDLFGAHQWCIWPITRPIEHGKSTGKRSRNADIAWPAEYVTQLLSLKASTKSSTENSIQEWYRSFIDHCPFFKAAIAL